MTGLPRPRMTGIPRPRRVALGRSGALGRSAGIPPARRSFSVGGSDHREPRDLSVRGSAYRRSADLLIGELRTRFSPAWPLSPAFLIDTNTIRNRPKPL